MADVSKIQGPSGSPENIGRKEKSSADADKFKQAMHRKVTEVTKIDPDEQKKRKRREEAEEDEELEGVPQGPTTPANQVTPFSLEEKAKKISPSEMQKGGQGISPTESAQPTRTSPGKATFYQTPSSSEMQDDSGMLEEESFIENIPSRTPGATQTPTSQTPQEGTPITPQAQQPIVAAGSAESSEQQTGQKQQEPQKAAASRAKLQQPTIAPQTAEELKRQQKKKALPPQTGLSAASLEETPAKKVQDTSGFFEQMGKGKEEKQKPSTTEELEKEAEAQGVSGATPPSPFTQPLEDKEKKKVEETTSEALAPGMGPSEMLGPQITPPPMEPLPAYANLPAQVMELFDRMAGVMTVMTLSGMTETTITLNAPQFASSVFFGAQIIIQEFSTAPKAFNIQLNGNPQAVALFQGNADDLMAAFQAGNYNFRVNRLETGYLSERPLFKRKEKTGEKDKDQTGENPP
jgi:hypothetical protein